ncbi:hypothetical protein HAP41_0000009295 [Bradyrhizobium barranii subsp. apii]|jgi:hypothetical protein|uniref:Uncharacterized protein n=1 Tax=Bradyrhizobium barranii subsp. apii TaxID=2819348 RepID=A0A8T5VTS5_9BRAD|nr:MULTISPECIES: hypothetical protein [Bradyrhizobium]MCS3926755.1 hypothetical protein [Bradyrhizobium elkanii]MCS3967308.1 hypothetical protein [Bradyrhizobium japonicum]UPT89150.1 hypothetical protein HAP41_0000009295 [Bradyrhizobium barranii subsp. apii]UPT95086.1 hypothetical protein J4G48_0038595 [Bradyrhizobium barranii subsp. apii]
MTDSTPALTADEFASLTLVGKGQDDIPHAHGERLANLGYAIRRLGELELTSSGARRLATGE